MPRRASSPKTRASKLAAYDAKRDFTATSEPGPDAPVVPSERLRFMVHKHDATRLHYDVRLEVDGVLASWACPKGPSYDPSVKRLAIETEDHPLAYGDFEGRIPDGHYGAGDSLIWDQGHYDTVPPGRMHEQRKKGHLHLRFDGEKLHGGWHLVRTRPAGGKAQWLLFKATDGTERPDFDVVAERPESVKSGRSITRGPARLQRRAVAGVDPQALLARVSTPMLATLSEVESAPGDQFVYEVKYDGFRALAAISGQALAVRSRNDLDLLERFPFVREALQQLAVREAVIDGELVGLDAEGRSRFDRLGEVSAAQRLVVFDVLWLDGRDLRSEPLEDRRGVLESLLSGAKPPLVLAQRVDGPAEKALEAARSAGWEGVIAKRRGSTYVNARSTDWLKLKIQNTAELAIIGWTPHAANDDAIGALLLATHTPGGFAYAGKVGTGFSVKARRELHALLKSHEIERSPAGDAPRLRAAHWVQPTHVAQLGFTEWTRDGRLRHPSFLGLRDDKAPVETALETPRHAVPISHPKKVIYPVPGYTKAEVREYCEAVASVVVPALSGRPLSFQQFPNGVGGHGFFRHDAATAPEWASKIRVTHSDRTIEQLNVDRPETVWWLANQSALTWHMPSSRAPTLDAPDWVAFDFDPVEGGCKELITLVKALHGLLDELKLPSVPKTSGKRGLHVLVPLAPGHTHAAAVAFADAVSGVLAAKFSSIATVERMIKQRKNRLYVDAGQNGRLKTMVSPYSLRATEQATVSVPLEWDEVTLKLDPQRFTLKTVPKRLEKVGDLFAPALHGTARLPTVKD
ncbi:MAG: DNA ligase D [Archangium sp.]|nr:DNA ligase D [Archangium sp.]